MKIIISILVVFISHHAIGQISIDRVASFENYGQYIQPIINQIHDNNYKKEFAELKDNYVFWVYFQIDTTGSVINLHNKQKLKVPAIVVDYVYKLINKTSGKWSPEVKNCRLSVSDTIVCQFAMVKRKSRFDILNLEMELLNEDFILALWSKKNACSVTLR
jgi:hypothetical protein